VRTACKAFAHGGDEKSGCHGMFFVHMRQTLNNHGFISLPLQPFRGNRFNILFENAASLAYLSAYRTSFLESNATNRLLKSVLYDLKVPEYVAGCKALA
jgi:hypothetical protein